MSAQDLSADRRRSTRSQDRVLGFLILAAYGFGLILFLYAVKGSRRSTLFRLPLESELATAVWLPQGWSFFTRSPREQWAHVFVPTDDGQWVPLEDQEIADPSNALGLSRRTRANSVELALLLQQVPGEAWHDRQEEPSAALHGLEERIEVTNPSPRPSFTGTIGVALLEPVPWAWSYHGEEAITMPSSVAILEITCE